MTEREIFLAVLDLSAAERTVFLDKACGTDAALRSRVDALLTSHDAAGSFLGNPAVAADGPDCGATRTVGQESGEGTDDETPLGFLAPTTRPDSLGRIGHYEVLQVLGQGGFGIVFRAFDDVLHRVVAVKVLAPQMAATSPARKRFLREARSSAQVRHENVVQAYEVGEQPLPYIVMEFIPGETLQQRLNRTGPVEVAEVVRIGRQIAEGLAAAHANDLIHRDIKPGNVMIESGSQRVKITDFGLARAADDASISQSGIIAGTPMYMAPEQAKGERLDHRADLFSLGSVLYQMAAGRPPFRANGTLAVLKRVAEDTPRDIREITPETPQWLCSIISKLHAKNPDDRFQSAREVADLLADCEAKLKASQEVTNILPQARNSARRKRAWQTRLQVLALTTTVFALGMLYLFSRQATNEETRLGDWHEPANAPEEAGTPLATGWVTLFNGKDLSGWQGDRKSWTVEDGELVTRTPKDAALKPTVLCTVRNDYRNFHIRMEAKINEAGDSGLLFRIQRDKPILQVQIRTGQTGNLLIDSETIVNASGVAPPDRWFTMEVIAIGSQILVRINGVDGASWTVPDGIGRSGRIGLEAGFPDTEFRVRKLEVQELPATALWPTFTNSIGMEFVIVPKGESWLGGGKDQLGDREVHIPADFYLGKYEVTQEGWEKVMGADPSYFSRSGGGKDAVRDIPDADLRRFPVEQVSWDQCQLFVAKLNKLEMEPGWSYRLPTEAEWEYACRGGPMTYKADSAFDFYFAKPTNTLVPAQANFNNVLKRTCKVGSYQPNALGLYDMHGNVWEWCDDAGRTSDAASHRMTRGGCWHDDSSCCRAGLGIAHPTSYLNGALGLRLARVPAGASSPEAKTTPLAIAPFTNADVNRIAALPAEQQVEEVRKWLMRLNPGFDGKLGHKIEGGVVTEFRIETDHVKDIAPIRVWSGLRVLDCGAPNSNGQLADLAPLEGMNLTGLKRIVLYGTRVTDAGLACFKDCRNVTELWLNHTMVGDVGLAYFKDCNDLTSLWLEGTRVTDAGLASFKDCRDLTDLRLSGSLVGDVGLSYFKDCKNLNWLFLYDTRVTDAGLAHFQGCKRLIYVWLSSTKVTDAGLANLKDCTELTHLNLANTKVSDAGLANFKDCKNLTLLHLDGTAVGDAGLAHFKDCANLTDLNVAQTQMSDKGLAAFKGARLMNLYIDNTSVTDLTPLQGMPLELISVSPKRITRGLDILRGMKTIKTIGVAWNQLWPAAEFWERYDRGEFAKTSEATAWERSVASMPAEEQVTAVVARLKDLNPGFDAKVRTTIEKGVVTELFIVTYEGGKDFSPVRALTGLKTLKWDNGGAPTDLTPLKGMALEHLSIWCWKGTDLTPLKALPLKMLNCGGGHQKLDLAPLAGLPLEFLCINFTQISDLTPLKGAPLTELECTNTPVEDLSALKGMPLHFLSLCNCKVSDLGPIQDLPLERIDIDGTLVTDLSPLKAMELKVIRLTPRNIGAKGMEILRGMTSLKNIGVAPNLLWPAAEFWERYDRGAFNDAELLRADRNAAEYVLSVGGTVKVDGGEKEIKAVENLPRDVFRLTEVVLRDNRLVTDEGLAVFKDCMDVTHLDLGSTPVTDAGLASFKGCTNLRVLNLCNTAVTDRGLGVFQNLKKLTHLDVNGCDKVTGSGLVVFKDCKELIQFCVEGTGLTDKELTLFTECKNLGAVNVRGTKVTDAGLAGFTDCKKIWFLCLGGTRVSDAGVAHLKDLKNIEKLYLESAAVTDEGLADLGGMMKLAELDVRKTRVTANGVEGLAKRLSKCRIIWDGGVIEGR